MADLFPAGADAAVRAARARIRGLSDQLQGGMITLDDWHSGMQQAVKELHMAEAVLARGGEANMGARDWARVSEIVEQQFSGVPGKFPGLRSFAEDIQRGRYGGPEELRSAFLQRANDYAESGRCTFENERLRQRGEQGQVEARRIPAAVEHCPDCLAWARLGWITIEEMLEKYAIGNGRCGVRCHCVMVTRSTAAALEDGRVESEEEPAVAEIEMRVGEVEDAGPAVQVPRLQNVLPQAQEAGGAPYAQARMSRQELDEVVARLSDPAAVIEDADVERLRAEVVGAGGFTGNVRARSRRWMEKNAPGVEPSSLNYHYYKHVVVGLEFPSDITAEAYNAIGMVMALDQGARIAIVELPQGPQLWVVRDTPDGERGLRGGDYEVLRYDLTDRTWWTLIQVKKDTHEKIVREHASRGKVKWIK